MSLKKGHSGSQAERLAYWYFRLNGFFTTENFIIHPDSGSDQRTDADLLAVRFTHRAENQVRPMKDDPKVADCKTFLNVVIAEIKEGQCALNGPWTKRRSGNMKRVIKATGCVSESDVDMACDGLYQDGVWSDSWTTIRLFAVGEYLNPDLSISKTQQLTWCEVIRFCIDRFKDYRREKASVGQWTEDGRRLREAAVGGTPVEDIRQLFGLQKLARTTGDA